MTDTQQKLNDAQLELLKQAQSSGLSDLWNSITPETQTALKNSLIGGLVGGIGGAGAGMMSEKKSPVSSGLMGALMGALAGGGGTLGYQLLSGQRKFPGEPQRPAVSIDSPIDYAGSKMISNPGLTAGTVGGGLYSWMRRPTAEKAIKLLQGDGRAGAMVPAITALNSPATTSLSSARPIVADAQKYGPAASAYMAEGMGYRSPWLTRMAQNPRLRRVADLLNRKLALSKFLRSNSLGSIGSLAAIPAGMGIGYLADRYMRGENE